MLNFLTESTTGFKETPTIGAFGEGRTKNSFESIYESAYDDLMQNNINPMLDTTAMVKNDTIMESYKDALLEQLRNDCDELESRSENGRYASLYEQVSQLFDNTRDDLVTETTSVGQLLPIKAIDFPVLVKQHLKIAAKDIVQTEVTKSPIIKKHIERTWIVDNKTKKRWEYPQCFFKDDFKEIYNAGKGLPIKSDQVSIETPLFNYNIVEELTDAEDPTREHITMDLKIVKAILEDGHEIPMNMRINPADGTWLGGKIHETYTPDRGEATTVEDMIMGTVDFISNTVTLSAANGKVKKVVFEGYLSNELNERGVSFDYTREEFEWKIEDGFRADIPYSLEELQDAKALLDLDLYKKTYDNLAELLAQMEDSKILEFLDNEYEKYKGVELDPLGLNPFIREQEFDCDSSTQTVALQSEYIERMLKFLVDRFIIDISDTAKMENMTFVIYGNPRYISLLDPAVNWVVKSGDTVGGVKANYSYGVMNSGNVKVQVVSTMKIDGVKNKKLRVIPYPMTEEQMTFKHYKYATHILTAANSGYKSADRPGGSMTNLMGTTRNVTASVQGIQGSISFLNTPFILAK